MKEDEVKISDEQRESCRMPSADGLEAARLYLESYRHGCRMLRADRYAREYFDDGFDRDDEEKREDELDMSLVRARLCAVRSFVSSLPCGETGRMLLYYHYIRGIPVAECAEMLDLSRAGAFRLRQRALAAAARALEQSRGITPMRR